MKTSKKQTRSIAIIFSILILFQSCTVYKSTSITLEQAVKKESKLKVKTKSGENLKFNRIELENGSFFGIKQINGEVVKMRLDETYISEVKEKDKTFSTILSIGLPLVIVLTGLAIGGAAATQGFDSNFEY